MSAASSGSDGTIFVTGSTGVVGSALLEKFTTHPATRHRKIVCLSHRRPPEVEGVEAVAGDVCAPDLGLSSSVLRRLERECSAIVRSAGISSYAAAPADVMAVNVEGTRRVAGLAEQVGANLYYLSSAMLHVFAGEPTADDGAARGRIIDVGPYARSKARAEEAIRTSGVPATFVRPALIVGDSRTGRISRFQGVHMLARFVFEDSIPVLPVAPDARFDFLPQDVIAEAVTLLVASGRAGGITWTTAGERALTVQEVLDVTAAYGAEIGKTVRLPRIVAPDIVERLIRPVLLEHFPEREQRRFEDMLALVQPLITTTPLPSSLPDLEEQGLRSDFDLADALLRSLRYWGTRKRIAQRVR